MGTLVMYSPEFETPATHHSPAQILEALKALQNSEKAALLKVARIYARTRQTRYDYEDLLQEAIARVLEGTRKWPMEVPFMAFMCGVMRGIAWDWRAEVPRGAEEDEALRPEEDDAIAKVDAQKLVGLFADDPIAQELIVGLMEGARGEELWESSGLTKTEYESKRKKIRRRIERMWLREDV